MITDPRVVVFVGNDLRVLCEAQRAINVRIAAMQTEWFGGINALVPNDATVLDDHRDAEGVSRLTGAQITNAVSNLFAILAASNAEILSLPCVRPLNAS